MADGELTTGATAYDKKLKRYGRVMEIRQETVALRPPSGGIEWSQTLAEVRPAPLSEVLSHRMRASGLLPEAEAQ